MASMKMVKMRMMMIWLLFMLLVVIRNMCVSVYACLYLSVSVCVSECVRSRDDELFSWLNNQHLTRYLPHFVATNWTQLFNAFFCVHHQY